MPSKALIIHGYGGSNQGNWFPWLKTELKKIGWNVDAPNLPNTNKPQLTEQLSVLANIWNSRELHTEGKRILIGHSLGGSLLLHLLEQDWKDPLDIAIIVASTSHKNHLPELEDYFATPHDFEKIKKNCKKFILIFSDNDPYINTETGPYYQHQLGENTELFMIHDAGHFMGRDGYETFPMILELIQKAYPLLSHLHAD